MTLHTEMAAQAMGSAYELEKVTEIDQIMSFGVMVVPSTLPPRQKAQLRELLLAMHEDVAGQTVLQELDIDRFVEVENAAYDGVRAIVHATGIGE